MTNILLDTEYVDKLKSRIAELEAWHDDTLAKLLERERLNIILQKKNEGLEAELGNTAPYYMDCLDRERTLTAELKSARDGSSLLEVIAERDRVMRENGKLNCHIDDLEIERDRLLGALLAAKGSLPNDVNYNDPWSLCIAIIDEALEETT